MRQYNYQATDDAIAAFRKLRGAWSRLHVIDTAVTVVLSDGMGVVIQAEAADVEDAFEAFRLTAAVDPSPMVHGESCDTFNVAGNDIVVFTGATWGEQGAAITDPVVRESSTMVFSGHPGQIPDSADVVCLTSDAVVVVDANGVGMLIRTGLKPYSLDVIRDAAQVRQFLVERGYAAEG